MTNKTRGRNISTWPATELREEGIPYVVDPAELVMLGIDPAPYRRIIGDDAVRFLLDRTDDADIIERLSTMRDRPMSDSRN
jgi:hypothetical protein